MQEPRCDCFSFIHILSYRFNPVRSQLETVFDFWLVNVCMKECDLITEGHTFGILAVFIYIKSKKEDDAREPKEANTAYE